MSKAHAVDRYVNMQFPPYRYREYPKWVKTASGQNILIQNQQEEDAVLCATAEEGSGIARNVQERAALEDQRRRLSGDRDALIERAGDLGIVVDRRVSVQNLQKLIADAEKAQEDAALDKKNAAAGRL
jgi:hypothetical protein